MTTHAMTDAENLLQAALNAWERGAHGAGCLMALALEEVAEERGELVSTVLMEWELDPGLAEEAERQAIACGCEMGKGERG